MASVLKGVSSASLEVGMAGVNIFFGRFKVMILDLKFMDKW